MWIHVVGWVYMFVGSYILFWHAADTCMTSQATADCKRNCGYECVQDDNSLQPAGYRQAERRDRATMPGVPLLLPALHWFSLCVIFSHA